MRTHPKNGIQNAKYVLVIATENAARSSYVAEEIRLARKHGRTIIPIFVDAKYLTDLGLNGIQGIQAVNFGQPFDTAIEQLIAALPAATTMTHPLSHVNLKDILEEGTLTFGEAEKRWRAALSFGGRKRAECPVGLLIGRSSRGMNAFLVGRRNERMSQPDVVQVFLQFANHVDEPVFDAYLEYIAARPNKSLWTVLVRAPIIHVEDEGLCFSLSDSDEEEWEEAVQFILSDALPKGRGTCRHVEFYLQAPGALIMALGLRQKFDFQCDVYHFSRGYPPPDQRYRRGYGYPPPDQRCMRIYSIRSG